MTLPNTVSKSFAPGRARLLPSQDTSGAGGSAGASPYPRFRHAMRICCACAALCLWRPLEAGAAIGATTPFVCVEGEVGYLGGGAAVVSLTAPPDDPYSSAVLEASGHAYAQLTGAGQFVQWTNNTGQAITALNLRSCIPDAPAGGGIASSIGLYVNGAFRQAFSVNSLQNYCYEGTNYNGQIDKNPADGNPRGFWNDTHAFISGAAVAPGDTIRFQVDSSNTAAFYDIDVVDLEAPPPPSAQPTNSISITQYGAISNNINFDNTSAINNCFGAARAQKKSAWIPPGVFYFSAIHGGLNASGIAIAGAGPWYSVLYRLTPQGNTQGVANIITTSSCVLSNVALDCNGSSRAGSNNNGAVNFSGTNWLVDNVWIQHATSAFWCAGVNGVARNCRVLSVWSDGGNFNNVQSDDGIGMNLVYSNNFVRGTGDDAMAINSVNLNVFGSTTYYYTMMSNITYVNNTAIAPWGGKCIGLYGGAGDLCANNLLCDTARYLGLGVMKFGVNGSDLVSAVVTNNIVLHCGGNGYNQQQQGMMIGNGGDGQSVGAVANAYCAWNSIIDALYDGVGISTSTNIIFEHNTIISPGMDGVAVGAPDLGSGVTGYAVFNNNVLSNLPAGRAGFVNSAPGYVSGGVGNIGFTVPGPLPNPWLDQDLGSVAAVGGASCSKSTFTVAGSGADIGGGADAGHFVYQSASGDCAIAARVLTEELQTPAAKAGLMMRSSLDSSAMEASILVTPAHAVLFETRDAYGGSTSIAFTQAPPFPCWLRLTRAGDSLSGAYSLNGAAWTAIGSPVALGMTAKIEIGLAVASGADGALCSAMFDNVAAPGASYPGIRWEGDLIANLQSADLSPASSIWTNRASGASSVGNFSRAVGNLNVATLPWNATPVKALNVATNVRNAVVSALPVPASVSGDNPVSVEAWIYATAVNQQNSCAVAYGIQGGPGAPQEDREFNYCTPWGGGGVSGDFGGYDTAWHTTPAPGAWHYLAWTYDGATVKLYLDGALDAYNSPAAPLETPATVLAVGGGLDVASNLNVDGFQGYIAAVRVETGVLTAADIAANYALGLVAQPVSVSPFAFNFQTTAGHLQITWPQDHTGWHLQVQTNSSGGGLNGNWLDVPNSNLTNRMTLPLDSTNGSVFYRLAFP